MDIVGLLELSVKENASDLHLSPDSYPVMRINGQLITRKDIPSLCVDTFESSLFSLMDKTQKEIFEQSHELDFAIILPNIGGFRANLFKHIHGIACVFRIIPAITPTLEGIDAPQVFRSLLELSSGLILLTGATGCGKSTTLAAMVDYINKHHSRHIITIEDPVEFTYENNQCLIHQRQVHRDTASFSVALRAALREDPDVILVGEMRDLETIRLALTAAETGHLILSTLHTRSAPRAINRIVDVFPAIEKNVIRNMVSESIQAVVYQTLVKEISGKRRAAYEIMIGNQAIKNLIREDKISQMYSVIQTNSDLGMCTMKQSLTDLIDREIISADSVDLSYFQSELFVKS
jgi:twitching motility protein PilT